MAVVIDASVALEWVAEEPGSDKAATLQSETWIAPAIGLVEAGNALWKHAERGEITHEEAVERLSRLRRAPVRITGTEGDTEAALELFLLIDHPICDCLSLALASRVEPLLVTADKRLQSASGQSDRCNSRVRLLDDLDPPSVSG